MFDQINVSLCILIVSILSMKKKELTPELNGTFT